MTTAEPYESVASISFDGTDAQQSPITGALADIPLPGNKNTVIIQRLLDSALVETWHQLQDLCTAASRRGPYGDCVSSSLGTMLDPSAVAMPHERQNTAGACPGRIDQGMPTKHAATMTVKGSGIGFTRGASLYQDGIYFPAAVAVTSSGTIDSAPGTKASKCPQ